MLVLGLVGLFGPVGAAAFAQEESDVYGHFNVFCINHFGAESEEESYRMFGEDLRILEEGSWQYVSETSACVAWQTNLPSKSCVEYGLDDSYGERTAEPERPFSLHLHYLKDLRPDTTYHYRLVCTDPRRRQVASRDLTLTTKSMPAAVRIPDDLPGPPYMLDQPNTTYLVTRDLAAGATAMNIVADGVTLDLGGHSVVYDNEAGAADPSANERTFGWHAAQNPCGLRTADGKRQMLIVNGTIRQGKGRSTSRPFGFNPLFLRRPRQTEIAGLTIVYCGSQVTGMMVDSDHADDGVEVHHNVIVDEGTELYNRHLGVDGIRGIVAKCHHNLVKRTRHRGLTVGSESDVFANEIYVDSYATNSYGIMYYDNRGARNLSLHHNRVFGTGFHPIGIGSGQGFSDVKVYANYIQMQGTRFERRWTSGTGGGDPAGQRSPVNGIRLQRPRQNIEHSDNVVVVKGYGEGCEMRGLWLVPDEQTGGGIVVRDNTVKLIAQDNLATGYAIACCSGADPPAVLLEGNTIISNVQHVQCGDNYGGSSRNFRFLSNTFVRVGNDPRYRTIGLGWQGLQYESFGHQFIDTRFEGGAGYEHVSFDGARQGRYDFSCGWLVELQASPGANLLVEDKTGSAVFSGEFPPTGRLLLPLVEYVHSPGGKAALTPHKLTLKTNGTTRTREVNVAGNQTIVLETR